MYEMFLTQLATFNVCFCMTCEKQNERNMR